MAQPPVVATSLSVLANAKRPFSRASREMARRSLGLIAVALGASGCLVTSTQEFEAFAPAQGTPNLLASDAAPELGELVTIEQGVITQPFRASVLSEDAGQSLGVRLLVNYGVTNESGDPYFDFWVDSDVTAATLADGPRTISAVLPVDRRMPDGPGCYTVTMIVSHAFPPETGCPRELSDSDELTWSVLRRCNNNGSECITGIDPEVDCPAATASCPDAVP